MTMITSAENKKEGLIVKEAVGKQKKATLEITQKIASSEWNRAQFILKIALPAIFSSLVYKIRDTFNIIALGHLDEKELMAGVGMGNACIHLMGLSIILGLNSALDTLVSNAAGAGDLELCGVYLNRARVILTVCFLPIILIQRQLEGILLAAGQDAKVSAYTAEFIFYSLPGLYLLALQNAQLKFLNNLGKTKVPMYCNMVTVVMHPIWLYYLTDKDQLNLRMVGVGIANVISYALVLSLNLIYSSMLDDIKDSIFWPDARSFYGLWTQVLIGS
mmetsp:Transcript_12782/g.21610  ORF Transcript_12782/g.21610 Transcript_12782/m.21610 type:complete len:275 (+) Transcript_12782:30-854(+)